MGQYSKTGLILIISNKGFKEGNYIIEKIYCSYSRYAEDAIKEHIDSYNENANTGTPGNYFCAFNKFTYNADEAWATIYQKLPINKNFSIKIDLNDAKKSIEDVCVEINNEIVKKEHEKYGIKKEEPSKTATVLSYIWSIAIISLIILFIFR